MNKSFSLDSNYSLKLPDRPQNLPHRTWTHDHNISKILVIVLFPTMFKPVALNPPPLSFSPSAPGFLSTSTCTRAWWCSRLTRRPRTAQRSPWRRPGIRSTSLTTPPSRTSSSSEGPGTMWRFRSGRTGSRHANVSLVNNTNLQRTSLEKKYKSNEIQKNNIKRGLLLEILEIRFGDKQAQCFFTQIKRISSCQMFAEFTKRSK